MNIKKLIKCFLPNPIIKVLRKYKNFFQLLNSYLYDFKRFKKYSITFKLDSRNQLEALIIKHYHMIEKGLTMPKRRLGFGQDIVIILSDQCLLFLSKYNVLSEQVIQAVAVLEQYKKLHEENNFSLNNIVDKKLSNLFNLIHQRPDCLGKQLQYTNKEYFQYTKSEFTLFANSRKSVRNYIESPIPREKIESALKLAMNTPSACNRQSTRLHVFTQKDKIQKIFEFQNGNRGFGELATSLIVISADLSCFGDAMERNQAFIDGGMFAMNLLYCLHSEEIACCILNCSNTPATDKKLQKVCDISESNVFIAMIACGLPPHEFMVAKSLRYYFNDVCKIDYEVSK